MEERREPEIQKMHSSDYKPLLLRDSDSEDLEQQEDVHDPDSPSSPRSKSLYITERVPPEWALLLLGCAVGLATGGSVVIFNLAVRDNLVFLGHAAFTWSQK